MADQGADPVYDLVRTHWHTLITFDEGRIDLSPEQVQVHLDETEAGMTEISAAAEDASWN